MRLSRPVLTIAFALLGSAAAVADDTKEEIRIGQTCPTAARYPASAHRPGAEAYFEKVNAEGGINGRKVKLISLDDAYSPPKTVEQTRRLVEQDEVLLMFGSLGTATNNAVHRYLNSKKVPQLFVAQRRDQMGRPEEFSVDHQRAWLLPVRRRMYAKHMLRTGPDAKIAILCPERRFRPRLCRRASSAGSATSGPA